MKSAIGSFPACALRRPGSASGFAGLRAFLACALLPLALFAGGARGAGLQLEMWPVPPVYSGTSYNFGVVFSKQDRNDGLTHHAPFTFRTTLPPGMTYTSYNGANWSCSNAGQVVTCVYGVDLHFWIPGSSSLGINAMVDPGIALGPMSISGTLESAEVPLPPNPPCAASPALNGCVSVATSAVASKVYFTGWGASGGAVTAGPVATWIGPPFEAGAIGVLTLDMHNIGYGPVNTPVAVDVLLPPKMHVDGLVNGIPSWTCQAPQLSPAGDRIRCTTPYMYDTLNSYLSLRVGMDSDVPVPGPLFVHAAISNNVQVAPADCVGNPLQQGCARLQVPTRTPRVATLVVDAVSHNPAVYTLGQEPGPLAITYRNVGEAAGAASNVHVQLPPHIRYLGVQSASPPMSCSVQGLPASGEVVTCSGVGMPAGLSGYVNLRVFAGAGAASPGPLNVLVGVDAAQPAGSGVLSSCAASPAQAFCNVHPVTTFFPCAAQWGDEGIFCDGLQVFVRP